MYRVLPTMHRLVDQVCDKYGVKIHHTIVSTEGITDYPSGRQTHFPYYIVRLEPNGAGWEYISCRPLRGKFTDFSASQNNVVVVLHRAGGEQVIIPSWRGRLLTEDGALPANYLYYIEKGYLPVEPYADLVEAAYISGRLKP